MIIFLDEDRAYLSWVRSHRCGFVLEASRKCKHGKRLLHRCTCAAIRSGKHRHWTTGQRLKACAMNPGELLDWVRETAGSSVQPCEACHPEAESPNEAAAGEASSVHLTPLAGNLLNYTLETALVHLSNGAARYRLTVRDVAACLHKTPAQLTQAIVRLLQAGLLTASQPLRRNGTFAENTSLAPTPSALRTLDGYAGWSEDKLQAEIARLWDPLNR